MYNHSYLSRNLLSFGWNDFNQPFCMVLRIWYSGKLGQYHGCLCSVLLVLLNVELHGTLNLGSVLRHHGMMGSTVTVIWLNMVFPEISHLIVVSIINSYCKSEAEVVSRVYRLFTKRYKVACKICGKTRSREIVLISPNRPISKKLGRKRQSVGFPGAMCWYDRVDRNLTGVSAAFLCRLSNFKVMWQFE